MKLYRFFILAMIIILAGCSSGRNSANIPTVPSNEPIADLSSVADNISATGILGAYELSIDPVTSSAEIIAKRTSSIGESYIVSGKGFFTMSPCSSCLKIKSIALTPEGYIQLTFDIKHPFVAGDQFKPPSAINRLDLDIFDVALVVKPVNATGAAYPLTGASVYTGIAVSPAGYTTELANLITNDAALPYYLVIDDSTTGTSTFNKFAMGSSSQFVTTFNPESGAFQFDLFVTMGYGFSAKKPQRLNPKYYNPEFNRKSAWKVVVTPPNGNDPPQAGNTWMDSDTTTSYNVKVEVFDWQAKSVVTSDPANYGDEVDTSKVYAASGVGSVSVEIPGMNSTLPTLTTDDGTGTGMPDSPLVFNVPVINQNGLPSGLYTGLVKVTDVRPVLTPTDGRDFLIDSPNGIALNNYEIPEYATYQTFAATVVVGSTIELTSPNGGETWRVGSTHDITWMTSLYTGEIKLEYSKDNFVSDINEIVASTTDDGLYEWLIPDDESTTVRVRASLASAPMVHDDSDDVFIIEKTAFAWEFDTIATFYGGGYGTGFDDISPAIIEESDHDIALTWAQTDTYNTFVGIDSVFRIRRSTNNGVTYDFEDYGDIASDYLPRADRNKIAAGMQADAYAMSSFTTSGNYITRVEDGHPNWAVFLSYPVRDDEIFVDSAGYIYGFSDQDTAVTMKHSVNPNLLGDPNWYPYPIFNIAPTAFVSHVRSVDEDSSTVVWLAFYNSAETQIKLAKSTGPSPHETWDASTVVYSAGSGISQVKNPGLQIDGTDTFHICYTRYNSSTSKYQLVYVKDDSSFLSPIEQVIYESTQQINDAHISVGSKFGSEIIVFVFETGKSIFLSTLIDGTLLDTVPEEIDNNTDDIDCDVILDTDQCDLHSVWSTAVGPNYDVARRNAVLAQQ